MKILYLSCHSILEYDEIKLFSELGADVFSYGAYRDPRVLDDQKRPKLDLPIHEDFIALTARDDKFHIPQKLIDWADLIIFMHRVDWVWANWHNLKGKRVILRTIGQNNIERENEIRPLRRDGLQIVRYSPREKTIPGYVGADAMIRFYKDPEEFSGWVGNVPGVLTIAQSMRQRDSACNWSFFDEATRPFPRCLLGPGNDDCGDVWGGQVPYEEMKRKLREYRAYFYTGTYPASYTLNFIEAAMTGIPIVALGPLFGNSPREVGQQTYEVPDWSDDGRVIPLADDPQMAMEHVKRLITDYPFAQEQNRRIRELAVRLFGKHTIKEQWRQFLFGS